MNKIKAIRAYHQRTKHQFGAYARGPEYLDWDNQPAPFRRFSGAEVTPLTLASDSNDQTSQMNFNGISKLLELSMGISAWKAFGPDTWALRCNPSSGNLHPTEAYVVSHQIEGLNDGVYHYAPKEHALELRAQLDTQDNSPFCLIGLSSIVWREAWKYGERAYRYVQLDIGHALGAIRYAAATLGWSITILPVGDSAISALLGLSHENSFIDAEPELPDLLLQIFPEETLQLKELPKAIHWQGLANALGGDPYLNWPVLDEAHKACHEDQMPALVSASIANIRKAPPENLTKLIRQRRSAQSFIGKQSTLSLSAFETFLRQLIPSSDLLPWDVWRYPPRIHLVIFIHRVEGLEPGLYSLPRQAEALSSMQTAMRNDFEWAATAITDETLPLYRLLEGDMRKVARSLSCHQEIASASSFSFGMLAEFDKALEQGASAYRHMHWEAGLLGQVAYLAAEDIGIRGTGIGCFFDDSVHLTLGIEDSQWQSLYHFTVGYPRIDSRIQTLPPYAHLDSE